jgi:hypothetical protein
MVAMANSVMNEPDVGKCRTIRRTTPVISGIYKCMADITQCKYVFSLGNGHFCQHPQRAEFCCQHKNHRSAAAA